MSITGRRIFAPLLVLAAVPTYGEGQQTSIPNRHWPPGVQKVADESPALSPADVRAATAGRTRPWTHEELLARVAAAKGGG